VLDMSGLAQKFGPVMSHVRIAPSPAELHSVRVGTGAADLVLGCDLVVTSGSEALSKMNDKRSKVLVNATVSPTADFVKNPDWQLRGTDLQADIVDAAGAKNRRIRPGRKTRDRSHGRCDRHQHVHARLRVSERLGAACRRFALRAIELNGVAVEFNRKAFLWGRAPQPTSRAWSASRRRPRSFPSRKRSRATSMELIARRVEFLTAYQDRAYAERYRKLV